MVCVDISSGFANFNKIATETIDKIVSKNVKEFNPKYKSSFFENYRKINMMILFHKCENNTFVNPIDNKQSDDIFDYFIRYVVNAEVSKYFSDCRFLEKFYNKYAKIYYTKLASTVRNYTVESLTLKSSIIPFETAFTDLMNYYIDFEDAISELTLNILYACTKYYVTFCKTNEKTTGNTCSVTFSYSTDDAIEGYNFSLYDLFFKPNHSLKRLSKIFSHEYKFNYSTPFALITDDISFNTLKSYIKYDSFKEIDLKTNYVKKTSNLLYTLINQSIRYVFISQFKQAFGWYINKNINKYPEIKSIISDTNLYYTQDLIKTKKNVKFFEESINFCNEILSSKRKKKTLMNDKQNINEFNSYVESTVRYMRSRENVDMNIINILSKLYTFCFNKNQSGTPVYTTEIYKMFVSVCEYFHMETNIYLTKIKNYNFNDRWNQIIDKDLIIIPSNYIEYRIIKEF